MLPAKPIQDSPCYDALTFDKKNMDCFKESTKEYSSKTEGNPTSSEEDGTDSLRAQGEDDWQPASETDLQDIQALMQFMILMGENITWAMYREAILQRFGLAYDDLLTEIKKLKLVPGHKCSNQVFLLEFIMDQEGENEIRNELEECLGKEIVWEQEPVVIDQEISPQISLNAFTGVYNYQTMRVIAKKLGCHTKQICTLQVTILGGRSLVSTIVSGFLLEVTRRNFYYLSHDITTRGCEMVNISVTNAEETFVVETDALGRGIGVVLQQNGYPIAFMSKTLAPKHNPYQPMKKSFWLAENAAADALSRLPNTVELLQLTARVPKLSMDAFDLLFIIQKWQPVLQEIIKKLQQDNSSVKHYVWSANQLLRKGKLVVGNDNQLRQEILKFIHEGSQGGHSRMQATLKRLSAQVYWRKMAQEHAHSSAVERLLNCEIFTTSRAKVIPAGTTILVLVVLCLLRVDSIVS
ncbi:gypsy/ty3 retroelement polyprotein [Tanacetum coccineum]